MDVEPDANNEKERPKEHPLVDDSDLREEEPEVESFLVRVLRKLLFVVVDVARSEEHCDADGR